jgi:nucleotide-binding universal stress UspA family protein
MFRSILVAVDGSPNADRAVSAAAEIARVHGSKMTICHVFYIPEHYRSDMSGSLRDSVRHDGAEILAHAARVAAKEGVEAETRLLSEGHPAEAVIQLAEELGIGLLVAGARGRAQDDTRPMGSIATAILLGAGCSVLLVKKEKATA